MPAIDFREARARRKASGDQYDASLETTPERNALTTTGGHPLDSEESRAELRQLLEWFYLERDRQAGNRLEMALDADFYDSLQWDPEDAAELRSRGQMPLVYNEVAPMVDWVIGTERRSRVDWRVLPRTEDDVESADTKTKVLKYISDINNVAYARSRAFSDAIKAGIGWMDDGVRDDPTQDILYSKYEDWRRVLWDSASYEPDLSDARYIFRWRWVDLDVAELMFPDRVDKLRAAAEDAAHQVGEWDDVEDTWVVPTDSGSTGASGTRTIGGVGLMVDPKRRRVRLIEAQYRKPAKVKVMATGAFKGSILNGSDRVLAQHAAESGVNIVDKLMMRMHVAVFTEGDLIAHGASIFRHNRFTLTPLWCYRRSRDRMPYGVIRRVRDVQQDLNKRASKALFMLNTNQIIADEGAVEDWHETRDQADAPDGTIIKRAGKDFTLRRDTDAATGQIQMMTLAAQSIQKSAGVSQENMGRPTNAVSGEAIKARQLQGSVVTTEPFDNLRMAVQYQGEKQLSLAEQWYTEEKVVRLTGAKGALEWVRVNVPEVQPDGTVRFLNDITASAADFLVREQDYAGTLRQVMFESLNQMAMRLPPEISLRLLTIAMEFSDLPNKDEIADQIRKLTGERDPNKDPTPEEAEQMQAQAQQQAEAMQIQREAAMATLEEQRGKAAKVQAEAQKVMAEIESLRMGGGDGQAAMQMQIERAVAQVREQAAQQIDTLSQKLAKVTASNDAAILKVRTDADTQTEVARIQALGQERVAEIQAASDKSMKALTDRIEELSKIIGELQGTVEELESEDEKEDKAEPSAEAAPAPAPAPAAPITINVQVDAAKAEVKKSIVVTRDADGNLRGEVTEKPAQEDKK